MGLLLSSLFAYVGVYAGVWLGSLTAEELPVGRYRLRLVQLLLTIVLSILFLYQAVFDNSIVFVFLFVALFITELAFVLDSKIPKALTHPKSRTLFIYAILAFALLLSKPEFQFIVASVVFLYGLVTGSLISEPFVKDRKVIPWNKPFLVALQWTWPFAFVWLLLVILVR